MVKSLEERLKAVFEVVLERRFDSTDIDAQACEEWDSLNHIKLVIRLESEFGIMISPGDINDLYTDFAAVLAYLDAQTA